jgi:hypothetical protein
MRGSMASAASPRMPGVLQPQLSSGLSSNTAYAEWLLIIRHPHFDDHRTLVTLHARNGRAISRVTNSLVFFERKFVLCQIRKPAMVLIPENKNRPVTVRNPSGANSIMAP